MKKSFFLLLRLVYIWRPENTRVKRRFKTAGSVRAERLLFSGLLQRAIPGRHGQRIRDVPLSVAVRAAFKESAYTPLKERNGLFADARLDRVAAGGGLEVGGKHRTAALAGFRSILRLTEVGGMIVFATLVFSGVWGHGRPAFPASVPISQRHSLDLQDKSVRTEVEKYLGVPYRRGGLTRKGMDCSGFVRTIYQEIFGVDLPHHARSQHALKTFEKVYPEQLRTGDLIFFTATKSKKRINHVGIYLGGGEFAHAARTSGVIVSSLSNSHWKSRFFAAKRLSTENDPAPKSLEAYADSLTRDADQERSVTLGFAAGEFSRRKSIIDPSRFWEDPGEAVFGPELTYTQAMSDRLWTFRLGAFREVYIPGRTAYTPAEIRLEQEMGIPADISDMKYLDGIRLAGGLRVSDYLKITPSLTYFTADGYVDPVYQQRFSLGIDLGMGSWYYDWPISMALNYAELQSSSSRFDSPGDEVGIFDMSVTYRHRINANFHLLFTGEYAERYETDQQESEDPFTGKKRDEQGFSVELNITY